MRRGTGSSKTEKGEKCESSLNSHHGDTSLFPFPWFCRNQRDHLRRRVQQGQSTNGIAQKRCQSCLENSMRYWTFIVLIFLLSCTTQGCDKGPDKDAYSQWVVEQLALINKNVTLGEWKKIHPDESIELFSRNIGWTPVGDLWCARSRKELKLADGKGAVRFVYFYIPSVSPSQPLPSTEEVAGFIDKTCTLGTVWTQYEAPSISFGEQLRYENGLK